MALLPDKFKFVEHSTNKYNYVKERPLRYEGENDICVMPDIARYLSES